MSGASSLRNAVKRITHKERAQPSDRKKLGLLEKHKDYVERAKDFKKKKNYLTTLRKKADDRNPDEFYFRMHNSKVQNGAHMDISRTDLDHETINLLKTQDLGYIIHKKAVDEKKVEKLKENIHLIGDVHPRHHIVFVDDKRQLDSFDPATHFQTSSELVDRHFNRLRVSHIQDDADAVPVVPSSADKKRKNRSEELEELNQRLKRAKKLSSAMEELALQRNLARSKGARKKITIKKVVGREKKEKEVTLYKWGRERAR